MNLDADRLRRVTEGIGAVVEAEAQAAVTTAMAGHAPLAPTAQGFVRIVPSPLSDQRSQEKA